MFGVNETAGRFPKVKPAAVWMGMLEGAMVEVKSVYIDTHSGFVHSGRFLPGRLIKREEWERIARFPERSAGNAPF
jgi:hypothetical protein